MSDVEVTGLETDIDTRHRKERKDLQAKIQALKKTASKGDKKKRKEVLEEIAKLEIDLEKKQSEELNSRNAEKTAAASVKAAFTEEVKKGEEPVKEQQPQRVSKAQKRRDKKAKEERDREAELLVQQEDAKNGPRMKETRALKKLLKERGLCLHTISSDGDCLYNAIKHQLDVTQRPTYDIAHLRNETANYILNNKDSLIFYMTNNESGDPISDEEFVQYCDAVRNTPAWGGQVEIKALSNILQVPIEVLQATGPPAIQRDGSYPGPNLILTYHRHMYSLGEHYNSTKPAAANDQDEEEDDDNPGEGNLD